MFILNISEKDQLKSILLSKHKWQSIPMNMELKKFIRKTKISNDLF